MLKTLQKKDLMVRIVLGFIVCALGVSMLLYLVPGTGCSVEDRPNVVADVGGQEISIADVRLYLERIAGRQRLVPALQALYAKQVVDQLIYQRLIEMEAKRLGIRVTDEERAERIKRLLPTAFAGDAFVGIDRYSAEVQQRFQMTVPEFEERVRDGLLEERFQRLVTDGITVPPGEVEQEFRRRNEKVKIEYVLVKPEELESRIAVGEEELAQYFDKNKSRYQVPERRSVRYALLDLNQLRQRVAPTDEELRAYYKEHLDRYRIQNRVRVSHILFKTIGKTDAEVEEIRKKAAEVLEKAKRGAKFEELAKQYSEDTTTKAAGGDLGWIVQGQTVLEFEHAAFTLPKGSLSELVKTQYGFHILKVVDRETARTQSFEEVRSSILPIVSNEKVERTARELADNISAAVRKSGRRPLEELAKEFRLEVAETPPIGVSDPITDLGNTSELHEALSRLRPGELSAPIRIERGYVVLTVKEIQPAHQGSLAEVREKILADLRREKAAELAKTRAEELAQRSQSAEELAKAAKSFGLEMKTSEPFARTGSLPDVGSVRQLAAAFGMPVGKTAPPTFLGARWIVYRVVERQEAKPEELEKQRKSIEDQVLQSKRSLAYEAFRTALRERMAREGKLRINAESFKRLTSPT